MITLNYNEIIAKQKLLNSWIHRGLTLIGRILVVNTLAGSLFVYKMAILENISSKIVDKFYDIIHKLLWDGGNAKVPSEVLFCDKSAGGLRLVNLRKKTAVSCQSTMAI